MPQLWDPISVLQIVQDGRCMGYAPSQGRKCRRQIGTYFSAQSILEDIAIRQPDAAALRPTLESLAWHGLCSQNHKNQVHEMVAKWTRRIQDAYPPRPSRTYQRTDEPTSLASLSRSPASSSTITSRESSLLRKLQILENKLAAAEEELQTSKRRIETLERDLRIAKETARLTQTVTSSASTEHRQNPPASPLANTRTSELSSTRPIPPNMANINDLASMLEVMNALLSAARENRRDDIGDDTRDDIRNDTRDDTRDSTRGNMRDSTRENAREIPVRCPQTHVTRRPLSEECSICLEETQLSDASPDELVWDKGTCGRSLHKECFEIWREQCVRSGRTTTCPCCRARWVDECEC